MKTPEQWAQEIELRCVADNRRPRVAVEADVIREAVNEAVEWAGSTCDSPGTCTLAVALKVVNDLGPPA